MIRGTKYLRALTLGALMSAGLLVTTLTPRSGLAQTSKGTLTGVVRDASGAVIAGVDVTITNVETGSYPIWGYERWAYLKNGQQGAPSANQLAVINTLLAAVTNATYQTTSPIFTGNFGRLSLLQVERSSDGGPITSLLY